MPIVRASRSGRNQLRRDVEQIRSSLAEGRSTIISGEPRYLRKLRDALTADEHVRVFFGDDQTLDGDVPTLIVDLDGDKGGYV